MHDLPHNLEAEQSVIAGAMMRAESIVSLPLTSDAFYFARHAQIWQAIEAAARRTGVVNVVTVSDALRQAGHLDDIGGLEYLLALPDWLPSFELDAAAAIVQALATRRALIQAGGAIAAAGYDERTDLDAQLAQAQALLTAVTSRATPDRAQPIRETLDPWMDALTAGDRDGLYTVTGLRDLDAMLCGGLWRSDLVVLAARPGVGKSALALTIAHHVSLAGGIVPWFSLEMPRDQVLTRLVAMHTGIDAGRLRMRAVRREDLPLIANAINELRRAPLILDDMPTRTLAQIRAGCLKARAQYGDLALIVVDYLGLIRATERYAGQRVNEVGEISRGLKALAMELATPVLALHQLSRAVEGRTSHVPTLSDLRDSGNVEQDADAVLFIYREELYDKDSDTIGVAEVHIGKQRNGPMGVVPLRFDANTTRFTDLTYRTPDGYAEPPAPTRPPFRLQRQPAPADQVVDPHGLLSQSETDTTLSAFGGVPLSEDDRWD